MAFLADFCAQNLNYRFLAAQNNLLLEGLPKPYFKTPIPHYFFNKKLRSLKTFIFLKRVEFFRCNNFAVLKYVQKKHDDDQK